MDSVVLLTVDCLRRDHVGCYGYERPTTPNIDSLAETATLFEGYANCPGTRWAFQSIHTGTTTGKIDRLGIPEEITPLAEQLQRFGYSTAGFANNAWVSRKYDYDRGFDEYYSISETYDKKPTIWKVGRKLASIVPQGAIFNRYLKPIYNSVVDHQLSTETGYRPDHSDADTVDAALEWLDTVSQPYFLWIHFMDAHTPYGYWSDHLEAIRGSRDINHTARPHNLINEGERPPQHVIDIYDSCIRRVDEQVGRVIDAIDDPTVIIAGDHGEEFGTHGEFHDMSLYPSMTNIPLVISGESFPNGHRGSGHHLDLLPTIFREAGREPPEYTTSRPLQDGGYSEDEPIYFSLGTEHLGIQKDSYRIISKDGEIEIISLIDSPDASPPNNLIDELHSLLESYKNLMDEYNLRGPRDGVTDPEAMDDATRENLKDLGYI